MKTYEVKGFDYSHCPNCGAPAADYDWSAAEMDDLDGYDQWFTCMGCGKDFRLWHECVASECFDGDGREMVPWPGVGTWALSIFKEYRELYQLAGHPPRGKAWGLLESIYKEATGRDLKRDAEVVNLRLKAEAAAEATETD